MRRVTSLAGLGIAVATLMPAVAQATPTRTQVLSLVCQGSFEDAARVIDGLPADVHDTLITVSRAWLLAVAGDPARARELLAPLRATAPSGRLVDACTGAEITRPWAELVDATAKAPASVPTLDDPESSGWPIGAPPPKIAAPPATALPPPASASPSPAMANKAAPVAPAAQALAAKPAPHSGTDAAAGKAPKAPETPKGASPPVTPSVPAPASPPAQTPAPAAPAASASGSFVQLGVIRVRSSAPVILAAARAVLPNLPGMEGLVLEPIQGRDLLRMLVPVDDPVATCRALADRRVPCIAHPPRRK